MEKEKKPLPLSKGVRSGFNKGILEGVAASRLRILCTNITADRKKKKLKTPAGWEGEGRETERLTNGERREGMERRPAASERVTSREKKKLRVGKRDPMCPREKCAQKLRAVGSREGKIREERRGEQQAKTKRGKTSAIACGEARGIV